MYYFEICANEHRTYNKLSGCKAKPSRPAIIVLATGVTAAFEALFAMDSYVLAVLTDASKNVSIWCVD
jgi:hypothetical protein